jgi:hypothetical protein
VALGRVSMQPAASAPPAARKSINAAAGSKAAPFSSSAIHKTIVTPQKPAPVKHSFSFSSASKKAPSDEEVQYFTVDNEVSFSMGSCKKPTAAAAKATPTQSVPAPKGQGKPKTRKVPDFKKMHSAQFSAQKSIAKKSMVKLHIIISHDT